MNIAKLAQGLRLIAEALEDKGEALEEREAIQAEAAQAEAAQAPDVQIIRERCIELSKAGHRAEVTQLIGNRKVSDMTPGELIQLSKDLEKIGA